MEPPQNQGGGSTITTPTALMNSSISSNELVYGGVNSNSGSEDAQSQHVMSDKVQLIASSIYKEFESMINKSGQESVKDLMPLVVNVLENLDNAYSEKEELVVDLEMLKEENEQLLNQYERERQMRKNQDQKCLEVEESYLEQTRQLEAKVESMTSIVRMLELKAKNASDHANRLEEREVDQKMEYEKLHERYNELLRTHIEHVERTKFLMGAEMFDMAQSLPMNNAKNNKNAMAMSAIDSTNVRGISDLISAVHMSQSTHADMNLANHISSERDWHEEFGSQTAAEILATPREQEAKHKTLAEVNEEDGDGEERAANVEDKELNEEGDGISLGADLTGMGREVENLIRENTELLETKNALNIVKNDLIARVDQLSSEREVFREEVRSLELVKLKLNDRIRDLESELKEIREKIMQDETTEEEDMAQRKRFTRVEMARVLMERNQYKEKLFELQEAVKFTELQRARKGTAATQNKSIIWSFFSNLLGDSTSQASTVRHLPHSAKKPPTGLRKNIPSSPMQQRKKQRAYTIEGEVEEKRQAERRQHYNAVRQHMKQEDYPHAYGWSIPSTKTTAQNMSIPVPVNCRPLLEHLSSLKISCAASCSLYGGISYGEYIYGDPILGTDPYVMFQNVLQRSNNSAENANENKTIGDLKRWNGSQFSLFESTSLIWICCTNDSQKPYIIILDVNNPSCILETFTIDIQSEHLCIASIPGVHESDIRITVEGLSPNSELCTKGGYMDKEKLEFEIPNFESFGAVDFIKLQKSKEPDGITYISEGNSQQSTSPYKRRKSSASVKSDENESAGRLVANDGTQEQKQKPALHRTAAIPIQDENEERKNENNERKIVEKIENDGDKKPGAEIAQEEQDKKPSPLDTLPLHIRNTLKRYENVPDDDILALSTMWIGTENECIYMYSAVREWRKCLRRIFLPDTVLSILHSNGRVFIALANGSIAIFHRDMSGQWSAEGYHLMSLGASDASICHLCEVNGKIWAACKNSIIVFDPVTLRIDHIFMAHPRKDSKIRQMVAYGNGVWVSIRLDTTIRLFHAETHEHLQDVDVGAFITKMLGPNKLDMILLRITSLSIMNKRIWIGTGSGIIVSIPLSENNSTNSATKSIDGERVRGPGQVVRVMSTSTDAANSIIPFCEISQAQLSFHSFKDPVRFLIPLFADGFSDLTPNTESVKLYMVSGGDGYIDFRLVNRKNESAGRLVANDGTQEQKQKPALHRTAAIPIQDENEERKNENNERKIVEKIENDGDKKPGAEIAQEEQDKKPSPLDTLPLHIRNTLKRYENVPDDDILALSTMWIGTENECIYMYSAVREWRKCLRRIFLPDTVLSILHSNGRVFIALANGSIAIFHRDMSGQWSAEGYHLMSLGASDASICHLCEVNGKIWAACKNSIIVFDPVTLRIDHIFMAHPRKDSKIRQMVAYGNGVWVSIRLDTTIRLFHAETHEHLQDVDVGAFITKMLGPNKLDMILLRITSLSIMNKRIWIGTGSGIIVSIPLSENNSTNSATKSIDGERVRGPGQVVRVMSTSTDAANSIIPFCEISQAQLSFHSFKDPVRFLIPLFADGFSDLTPNTESVKLYMVSGGDGYIDFRLGDDQEGEPAAENPISNEENSVRVRDMSHLLIWESESSMNFIRKTANKE